jgi:hypothetical protein
LKIFQKPKFFEQEKYGRLDSNLFHSSTTQNEMVDTSKFISKGEAWNNIYEGIIPFEEMVHLSPQTFT